MTSDSAIAGRRLHDEGPDHIGPGPSSTAAVFVQRDARYVGVMPWEAGARGQPEVTRVLTRPRSYRDDLQKEFGSAILLISPRPGGRG